MTGRVLIEMLLVGSGGAVGSMARYALSVGVQRTWPMAFPLGTLAVNVSGCLAIGVLAGLFDARELLTPNLRLFLMLGVLGGYTTFSTFGYETHALIRNGDHLRAGLNAVGSLVLCLVAVWLGHLAGRNLG